MSGFGGTPAHAIDLRLRRGLVFGSATDDSVAAGCIVISALCRRSRAMEIRASTGRASRVRAIPREGRAWLAASLRPVGERE